MREDELHGSVARLRAAGCVFAEAEARLLHEADDDPSVVSALVERRAGGEPLEYVLGWAGFRGRRYVLEPGVFVPRHRSDLLVETALTLVRAGDVVLDLCCGCGALAAALSHECGVPVEIHAADLDPAAVRCARRNLGVAVHQGDLFDPLPASLRGRVDLLLANAPYVPTAQIALLPPEAREHEARAALDGGEDGAAVQRRVIAAAAGWLSPGGALITETSPGQVEILRDYAREQGLRTRAVGDENATVLLCKGNY